jgi:hypothetical protein
MEIEVTLVEKVDSKLADPVSSVVVHKGSKGNIPWCARQVHETFASDMRM